MDAHPTSHLVTKDNPARGILLMLTSVFFFALMNIIVKYMGDRVNVLQVAFFRCLFALVPTLIMVATTTGITGLKTKRWKGHLFRATAGTLSMVTLFFSFHLLPLADAVALNFTGPLFLTLFSIFLLKERVSALRWLALVIGFIGILIVVQPGSTDNGISNLGIIVGFTNAFFYALSMIGVRSLGKTEAPSTTVFYFTALSTIIMSFAMPWVWTPPDWFSFVLLASGGIFAGLAQLFMTRAFQYAPAAVISPYSYSAIFWAALLGFIFWGEVPGLNVYLGGGIVILAGVGAFFFETRTQKDKDVNTQPPALT